MKRLLIVLGLLAVSCGSVAAQSAPQPAAKPATDDSPTQQALIKLTKEWIDAEDRRDGATLDRLLADDFVGTAPSGVKATKKMVVPDPKGQGVVSPSPVTTSFHASTATWASCSATARGREKTRAHFASPSLS